MTLFEPTLIVNRLRVERNNSSVYDEMFHAGVNIIRGENSSGKSTLLNFIFYGLGGDLADWSEVALLCSRIYLEVSINSNVATLSRDISRELGQPMDIFGGPMDLALRAPKPEWNRYPYKRSPSKESFSQALFRLLGMPEVANDVSGNVTMHQILRLLYSDQLSPVENIFKFERFDPPALRDAVGRLLCGAYDNKLYENDLAIRRLNKEFDSANGELRSLLSVLGRAQEPLTLEWIGGQRRNLDQRRKSLEGEIAVAEKKFYSAQTEDRLTLEAQGAAYDEVRNLQRQIGELRDRRDGIALSITDSQSFISSLQQKIKALTDARTTASFVGEIEFQICPVCLAQVGKTDGSHCHLCKTPFDVGRTKQRIVALINDTALQLKQSEFLQKFREEELDALSKEVAQLEEKWRQASDKMMELRRLPSGPLQDALRALQRQSGYFDREAEDLEKRASIAALVDQLSQRKAELNAEITRLKSENEALQVSQQQRLSRAYTEIADEVRDLLSHDLRRQDSFENPQSIQFDFFSNSISVDGHSYFSASSRVILKSSFFAAFLAAATKDSSFRHPRFCLIDTIEDKGMEPQRSKNFQLLLAKISQQAKSEHQIIFATAMITPQLDEPEFVVGKFSTRDDFTLDIKG